jgi:hypothetical protein
MAIIIRGKTECPLCGEVLRGGDDLMASPPFLQSGLLFRFSDAAMHRACFTNWPLADKFIAAFNEIGRCWPGGPRRMLADGTIIDLDAESMPPAYEGKPVLTLGILGDAEERAQLFTALAVLRERRNST